MHQKNKHKGTSGQNKLTRQDSVTNKSNINQMFMLKSVYHALLSTLVHSKLFVLKILFDTSHIIIWEYAIYSWLF